MPGLLVVEDLAMEGTWSAGPSRELGMKFETFNLFNNEEKLDVNNLTGATRRQRPPARRRAPSSGTATARGSFQGHRTFRLAGTVSVLKQGWWGGWGRQASRSAQSARSMSDPPPLRSPLTTLDAVEDGGQIDALQDRLAAGLFVNLVRDLVGEKLRQVRHVRMPEPIDLDRRGRTPR